MTTMMTAPTTQTEQTANDHHDRYDLPSRSRPVVLRLTPEHVRSLHRTIPILVGKVRRQLTSQRDEHARIIVLDLSDVPPTPAAAPLLFLVRLLRGLTDVDGRVEVAGVSPALAAALIPFDLPEGVTLVDTHGRRWPA